MATNLPLWQLEKPEYIGIICQNH